MKSLLVPINYTDNAANAARYATDLALSIEADIHLLHVMDLGFAFEETEEKGRELLYSMRATLLERSRAQIAISTFADAEQTSSTSTRSLLGHEAKPSGELAAILEALSITNCRHQRRRA